MILLDYSERKKILITISKMDNSAFLLFSVTVYKSCTFHVIKISNIYFC